MREAGMTLEELRTLHAQAVSQQSRELTFELESSGKIFIGTPSTFKRFDELGPAIQHLRTLAKPRNVMISVPYEWAERWANKAMKTTLAGSDVVQANCRLAVAPYQMP